MKTLDELYPSGRGDGKKYTQGAAMSFLFEPLFRDRFGVWHGECSTGKHMEISGSAPVIEWLPPKKTKKVTMYRPIKQASGSYYISHLWDSNKAHFNSLENIVGWQEMTVEIEE